MRRILPEAGFVDLEDLCGSFLLSGLRQPSFHHVMANDSGLLKDEIAVAENGEVRNALDFIAGGEFRECFRVDFDHNGATS